MGKRGKKLAISHDDRLQEIRKHNVFDEKGKIKKSSDSVWSIICDSLNQNQLTKKTYTTKKFAQLCFTKL